MYRLGLKNKTLIVYAALYSFSSGEYGVYFGSQKYLAASLEISVRTLQNSLKELFSLGLIKNELGKDKKTFGICCTERAEHKKRNAAQELS